MLPADVAADWLEAVVVTGWTSAIVEVVNEFVVEAAALLAVAAVRVAVADKVTVLLLDVAALFCTLTAGSSALAAAA